MTCYMRAAVVVKSGLPLETGIISSGVTMNWGGEGAAQMFKDNRPSLVKSPLRSTLSLFHSPPLCDFVPRSLLSPPSLPFSC